MLTELVNARQIPNEPARRWFTSSTMDLIVWHDANGSPTGFQLCYDKVLYEKAITWTEGTEPIHTAVSSGEEPGVKYKKSPILIADGMPDYSYIAACFLINSENLPPEIVDFVMRNLSTRI